MLINYEGTDLEVEFYEQKEEKEDGFVSLQRFIILETATENGLSIMRVLNDEQVEKIEEIIKRILDED
jgi:hypothetical protein|tara:strand:- start:1074 stop:1277 length:204 start_codon:yes stop_codon:yes gene_type:complete